MNSSQRYFGPYQLQQRLGGNGASEVWKALDEQQQKVVVLSILHVSQQEASEQLPRFVYETKNLQSLHHPNIAPILDVQVSSQPANQQLAASNDAYIVTEYVDGPSLATYMASTSHVQNFPSIANLHRILAPIASALDYAHQNGIIHGSINPASIIFDARSAAENFPGEPRIVNFGLHGMRSPLSLPLYDVCYMSPEIAQGHNENTRSDLYSLGVILYELCTGTLPFQGDTAADVMMQQIHAAPMSPVLINPRLFPGLTVIILRCLAKEPSARFPTASAMVAAIDRVLKSPASISLGLSNPGFTGPQQAISPVSKPGLNPASNPGLNRVSNPGFNPASNPGLNPVSNPGFNPASSPGFNPVSNSGYASVPSYDSVPTIIQYNQSSSALPSSAMSPGAGLSADASPTLLTPHNKARMEFSTAQTISPPPSNFAPAKKDAYASGGPSIAVRPPARPRRNMLPLILTLVFVSLVIFSGAAYLLINAYNSGLANNRPVFGHAFFTSSGLLDQNSTNGIVDGMQVDLQNLPAPQVGKSYYAWLLADKDISSNAPLALGALKMSDGHATTTFVDPQYQDLLSKYSRFLVTEEDAASPPANPSLDNANWRYAALFSSAPNPEDAENHYSVLDHLRHLLAQDPKLKSVNLTGGLDIWLFRNTLKILEWSGSARDAYKTGNTEFIRRQSVRVLDYMDSTQYVTTENIPSDLSPVLVNPVYGRVGMLQISPTQNPPGYLKHIGNHLREVALSGYVTPTQRQTANKMNVALNNVQRWFDNVHKDASQLVHMTPDQLKQPQALAILNDMFTQANRAFVGQTDPNTNNLEEGVSQIHYEAQSLATFDALACSSSNVKNFCV